jgi:ribonuclease VapC
MREATGGYEYRQEEDAELAAELWAATRHLGLALGDRSCLATAKRLKVPAVTADRNWTKIEDEDLRVECVR